MDVVSLALAKNYTNEKLNSLPSNAPTKTVNFDGGIYSVGNDVVNGQVSVTLKGRSLKNELNYNRETWAEWTKPTGVTVVNGELIITLNGSGFITPSLAANFKPSTKYGILAYATTPNSAGLQISYNLTGSFVLLLGIGLTGNTKQVITTQSSIATNVFKLTNSVAGTSGEQIIIKDVRVFELPTGSEIEADFETLTADELAQKYPYIKGDSVKSTNSVRLKFTGKNLFDKDLVGIKGNPTLKSFLPKTTLNGGLGSNLLSILISSNTRCSFVHAVKAGEKVILSYPSKYSSVVCHTVNSDWIINKSISFPYTADKDCLLFAVLKKSNNSDFTSIDIEELKNSIQIERGDTATTYEPYKESIVNVNLPEPLRSLPNGVKDEVNVTTGVKAQRVGNKTNVASGTVINYTDMATAGQFEAWGSGEHVVGVKGDTLAFTATSLNYQLATPIVTKLPAQAPLQVFENGTVYVEPIGDPSETTLPTVELTVPIASGNKVGIATHDYAGAAADWTLTNNESKCKSLLVTNAGGAANIIAPDKPGLTFTINNKSGQAITIKKSGGTGVVITNGKKVTVQHFGTDYEAISSEI